MEQALQWCEAYLFVGAVFSGIAAAWLGSQPGAVNAGNAVAMLINMWVWTVLWPVALVGVAMEFAFGRSS